MTASSYLWAVVALLLVLGLIAGLAWLAKKAGLMPGTAAVGARGRRVQVIEVTPLDVKRRLVLIQRDSVEHLILLGAESELVIETGIAAAQPLAASGLGGKA